MKVAAIADCHVGNHKVHGGASASGVNERCRMVLDVLARAVEKARKLGCTAFVSAGDLADSTRWEPQVVAAVQGAFSGCASGHLLLGNHDMVSTAKGDHALGPLAEKDRIDVVERPRLLAGNGQEEIALVPFQPGDARAWLVDAVRKTGLTRGSFRDPKRLLVLHLGIVDAETAPWLRDAADAVPLALVEEVAAEFGVSAVLAGNWHLRRSWKLEPRGTRTWPVAVLQVGALAPTGYDNPGVEGYGTLAVWDSEKPADVVVHELPGPRFVTADAPRALEEAAAVAEKRRCRLFGRVRASPERLPAAREAVVNLVAAGRLAGGEAVLDDAGAEEAARAGAEEARRAGTLEEAIAAHVAGMALPEGLVEEDRAEVVARVKGYLAKAG